MSVIGRVNGPMLKENLLRQGIDLAFETSLLYIDVNNGRIGVKTIIPNVDLDVNGIAVFNNALKIDGANITSTQTDANIYLTPNGSGQVVMSGNVSFSNISLSGNANVSYLDATYNVNARVLQSNVATGTAPIIVSSTTQVANLNVAVSGSVVNGNSNVVIPSANGNVNINSAGNTTLVITGTGANITGTANISGNANVGNLGTVTAIITTGNITTINSGLLQNGNSNVAITANSNVTITATSNATLVVTSTGANISGTANVSGNANVGNIGTVNIVGTGNANITGNITGGNLLTSGSGGNISGANVVLANTFTSNVTTGTAPFVINSTTQVANLNVATAGNLINGTSNVIVTGSGNITVGSSGNAAIFTVTGTGANISGTANVSGNANVGNIGAGDAVLTANIKIGGGAIKSSTGNTAITLSDKDVTVEGNLDVKGLVTLIESTTVTVNDLNIILGNNVSTSATLDGGGVDLGSNNLVTWRYNHSTTSWQSNVSILPTANGTLTLGGTSNYWGNAYVSNLLASGTANVTGNANVGNLGTATAIITTANVTTINSSLLQNGNSNVTITANGNVTVTATSNATLVITGTGANISGTANVSGNANVGNIGTSTIVATTANVSGNANIGNIDVGNIAMTANLTGANVIFANVFTANVTTGTAPLTVTSTTQVANLNVATAGNLINGTSNVIVTGSGNITVGSAGNAAILTVTGTGANISGTANISGNANVGNLGTTGEITASSNVTGGNLITTGYANIGNVAISNVTISTLQTNANLNLDPNGVGSVVINSSSDASNLVVNGTTANLLYADAANNRIGVLTDSIPTNVTVKVNSTSSVILPVGNSNQRPGTPIQAMFRFNTDTTNYEFYDGLNWKQASSTFTIISADEFTGDGSTTIFTLSQSSTTNGTIVAVNGLVKIPTVDYSVSGLLLTFVTAPTAGQKIDIRVLSTTTTVTSLSTGDTSVIVTDTGSNGTVTLTTDGASRFVANAYVNANAAIVSRLAGTSVDAATVVVDTFDKTLFRSAKYVVQVSNSGRGDYESSEFLAMHDGTVAYGTSYAVVYSNVELGNVSVAMNSGNVELSYSGNFAGNTVKLFKEYIPV